MRSSAGCRYSAGFSGWHYKGTTTMVPLLGHKHLWPMGHLNKTNKPHIKNIIYVYLFLLEYHFVCVYYKVSL